MSLMCVQRRAKRSELQSLTLCVVTENDHQKDKQSVPELRSLTLCVVTARLNKRSVPKCDHSRYAL
eukprot:4913847-Amphidinium_carterae.1